MFLRRKLEAKIADHQRKLHDLERQLAEGKAHLSGLQDSLKLLPLEGSAVPPESLRAGSDLAKTRDLLRKEAKPMHIEELLRRLGKDVIRNTSGVQYS